MKLQAQDQIPSGLYMVATPIGNLEDLSFRALRVLQRAHWIAAEDTRHSARLCQEFEIGAPLISFHEHSTESRVEELIVKLRKGEVGAYISDAGTPGVCDPGAALVKACVDAGIPVIPVPGASAVMALLSVSGSEASDFHFHGFFPRENKERKQWAERAKQIGGLQVGFESPHRINETLKFLSQHFADNSLLVGRELTKKFETLTRGTALEVATKLREEEPRGEYVFALDLPVAEAQCGVRLGDAEIRSLLEELKTMGAGQKLLVRVGMSHGLAKNQAYSLALEIQGK